MKSYVESSLELHLFFGRIMKEHALFMEAGFTDAGCCSKTEAKAFKEAFEELLRDAIQCSNGVIGVDICDAEELVTPYTLSSERATSRLTGGTIDYNITKMEKQLCASTYNCSKKEDCKLEAKVKQLNHRSLQLLEFFINFKQETLKKVLSCRMFTMNYPLLLEHIIREAQLYQRYIMNLEKDESCMQDDLREVELFWNQIMMEHALFIRGLLDPAEGKLISTADEFAGNYYELICEAQQMTDRTIDSVTDDILNETMKYRDFKETGTKGINDCGIRSLILPLLADHVLREANHYIRILKESKKN